MIDIRKLKELVRLMVENDLSELDLRDKEEKVTIKRGPEGVPMVAAAPVASAPQPAAAPAASSADAGGASSGAGDNGASDAGLVAIESPMVGTYYSKPNPDAASFVSSGATVSPDTVVCLVEAMKVFNEIKAETAGTVERILVKDGDSVEFGQRLMLVRPD